jgi:tetratricopeptide (TPR) repeat protein
VNHWQSLRWLVLLACLLLAGVPLSAEEDPPRRSSLQDLEEQVLPFTPREPLSDSATDRLHASALFAHGRVLYQRKEFAEAILRYQRAWQHDSTISSIPPEIVQLAINLKREDEAVRYASLSPSFPASQIARLPRIAVLLTNHGKFADAARVYRQMLALRRDSLAGSAVLAIQLELGRLESLAGDHEKSALAFEYVVKAMADPAGHKLSESDIQRVIIKPAVINSMIAESYLQSARLSEAEEIYNSLQQLDPNDALYCYRLAVLAHRRGEMETAGNKLAEYFEASSEDAGQAAFRLLEALFEQEIKNPGRVQRQFIRRLEELHQDDPDNRGLLAELMRKLIEAEEWSRALPYCEKMLDRQKSTLLYQQLLQVYLGLWESGNVDDHTVDVLVRLVATLSAGTRTFNSPILEKIAADKTLVERMLHMATTMLDDPESFVEKPEDEPGRSIAGRIVAKQVDVAVAVGSLAIGNKQPGGAEPLFEFAIAQQPSQRARHMESWGLELLIAEEFDKAIEVLERAVKSDQVKQKQGFYFFLASASEMAGDTQRALDAAHKAAALSPDNARIQSRIGWVYYHAKQYSDAEAAYLVLIQKFSDKFDSSATRDVLRETRMILSSICVQQKRLPEAEEWLEQVLDEFPGNIGAFNDLGYLWADQDKRLQRARRMIAVAVEADPENSAYQDSLGWAYYRLAQFDQAIEHLLLAARSSRQDGVILDHLGDAYLANGHAGKAREAWRKALKLLGQDELEMRQAVEQKLHKQPATGSISP